MPFQWIELAPSTGVVSVLPHRYL
ncbi:uncharacterized protein METZ01_LOCUS49808 [marine metagenome]|uniref:Uncharacterized protein n=1 Tax=marine metagenome TaxID=408172 RepID=A0A381S0J9_9ZZZZ